MARRVPIHGVAVSLALLLPPSAGCLQPTAPLAIRATRAALVATEGDGLRAEVLPYTAKQAKKAFGVDLNRRSIVAVEVRFERVGQNREVFKLRRTDVRACFPDGSERDGMDPAIVYRRVQVPAVGNSPILGLALAAENPSTLLAPTLDEDVRREAVFAASSVGVFRIDDEHPVLAGFVFFDGAGLEDRWPRCLRVEFENVSRSELRRLEVSIAPPTP